MLPWGVDGLPIPRLPQVLVMAGLALIHVHF